MTTRAATHSNSWYSGDKDTLDAQLDGWLEAVPSEIPDIGELPHPGARIIIAP